MQDPKLHLVQIDRGVIYNYKYLDDRPNLFDNNIKNHSFKGYLVNTSATALYLEPEDHNGLIIVPHSWVKWCIPITNTDKKIETENIDK